MNQSIEADAKRWQALRALPRDLNVKLYLIYMQALEECGDEVPETALALLDIIKGGDFYGLADRAGVDSKYKYQLYKRWFRPGAEAGQGDPVRPKVAEDRPVAAEVTPVIIVSAEECQSGPTALYRYFDADDLLLYVGISERLRVRTGDHVGGSSWMDFAVRSTIERHPSRDVAAKAETAAIEAEHPLFNQQHNNTPEARRRVVEYLIEHDRLDLLTPAVSRG